VPSVKVSFWFISPHHYWITQQYDEANANGHYNYKNKSMIKSATSPIGEGG